VQSVTEEMRRLGRMVESFLTLTKVRGGMTLVDPKIHGVNDLVMEAVQELRQESRRQYGVSLTPDLAEGRFPARCPAGMPSLLRVMID